ncbi:MAG: hypothetical protein ACYS30_16645 [Planctomycetota bacterium]|jgi:hypothetical protein
MSEIDEREIKGRFEVISQFELSPEVTARDLERIRKRLIEQTSGQRTRGQKMWRIIMKSRITKLATVAAIMIIVALSINFLGKSVAPAYAIEQTIEANRAVQHLHFKYFYKSHDDVAKEFWLEFDESGQLKNARINFSKWGEKMKHEY